MELIYSIDEDIWYWQRYSDWKVSQSFKSKQQAIKAKINNKLIWK